MTGLDSSLSALLGLLEQERDSFIAEMSRLPLHLRSTRLLEGRWTAVEIVEHVARVERSIGRMIRAAEAGGLASADVAQAIPSPMPAEVASQVRSRTERLVAPERVSPTGALTAEEALAALEESRTALLEAVGLVSTGLLDTFAWPHPFFGPLTLRAWLELIAHHDVRHGQQLADLVAAAEAGRGSEDDLATSE